MQETDKLVLLKGIEAGAGVNEFTFRGKNLFRIEGTSYYVSTVPHPEVGMRVPKTGTTSVYFIWQKGNAKKLASSPEFVGEIRFREFAKLVI